MVKRHHQIDFAAGALVFPGGKTHAGDDDVDYLLDKIDQLAVPHDLTEVAAHAAHAA
jgi:8-oxo-dGTP pyrophosphatase MutT (NUDIX family)